MASIFQTELTTNYQVPQNQWKSLATAVAGKAAQPRGNGAGDFQILMIPRLALSISA
jgi:hypothetical protein